MGSLASAASLPLGVTGQSCGLGSITGSLERILEAGCAMAAWEALNWLGLHPPNRGFSRPHSLPGVWPGAKHYPSLGLNILTCCVTQSWCKWPQVSADLALPKTFLLI